MKYQKTELGQQALKNRSIPLSPRQRSAFILFDGRRSVADVLQATEGLGVTREDVDYMTGMGLLEQATGVAQVPPQLEPPAAEFAALPDAERYRLAYPLAVQLAGTLGLKGYRLVLAVESAGNCDDLVKLLPRLQDVLGPQPCQALERVLRA